MAFDNLYLVGGIVNRGCRGFAVSGRDDVGLGHLLLDGQGLVDAGRRLVDVRVGLGTGEVGDVGEVVVADVGVTGTELLGSLEILLQLL